MKYVYVTSARRNPERNPKITEQEQLAKFYALDKKEKFPTYFISFTENLDDEYKARSRSHPQGQSKIGVNPRFRYSNPVGVYCYPLRYVCDENGLVVVSFATDRPFIQVVKLTVNDYRNHVLCDLTYNKSRLEQDKAKLEALYQSRLSQLTDERLIEINLESYITALERYAGVRDSRTLYSYNGQLPSFDRVDLDSFKMAKKFNVDAPLSLCHIWCLTHLLSYLLVGRSNSRMTTATWNKLLRHLGYVAVVDSGTGFIHPNEPTQAVLLINKAYEHVATINHINKEGSVLDFSNQIKLRSYLKDKLKKWSRDLIVIDGDLKITKDKIVNLPKTLIVNGDFIADYTLIGNLPETLTVQGNLGLQATKILGKFPTNLKARKVNLSESNIKYLPDNLTIDGSLYLSNSKLERLPRGLKVAGDLRLTNLKFTTLPDDLYVGKNLFLYYTNITEIPAGVFVGGEIMSDNQVHVVGK